MYFFLFLAVFIANSVSGRAQFSEETCDTAQLDDCIKKIPRTRIGLPRNREELDAHCGAYNIGMPCMDAWMKKCLPTDGKKVIEKQIAGARALMRFICANDSALRREYLREPSCWARASPDWSQCVEDLQKASRDIEERSKQMVYFNKNEQLCCARDEFVTCASVAGRTCSPAARTLLQRIAWVLAQDAVSCSQPHAHCSAHPAPPAPPPHAAPLLASVAALLLYPAWL